MNRKQISVFIENRAGRLDTVARLLGDHGINIRALTLADTSDFGILRLIVDQPEAATTLLKAHDFAVAVTDVCAVRVPDRPGGLADVLDVLKAGGINVEYMYAFVERAADQATLVFRFDQPEAALAALRAGGITGLTDG